MSETPSNLAVVHFCEDLLSRPSDQRKAKDILEIMSRIRHTSALFNSLEDGNTRQLMKEFNFVIKNSQIYRSSIERYRKHWLFTNVSSFFEVSFSLSRQML